MNEIPRQSQLRKLFTSAFFLDAGFFLLVAAIPYKVLSLGGGSLELGVTPTVSSVFYIVLTQLAGRASDRWGRYRMARYGVLALIAFSALAYNAPHWPRLLLVMPLLGLGAALFWPTIQAGIGDLSLGGKDLERNTGRFNVAWGLGKSLGFLAAGVLLSHYSFRATFLSAIGLMAISLMGLPREESESVADDAPVAADPLPDKRRLTFRRMGWLANMLAFGAGAILVNFLPQLFEQRSWSENRFGLLLGTLFLLQTLVFALLSGRIRFTYSLRRLLAPQILAGLALIAMPLSGSYWPLLALTPLLGLSFGVCYAASIYYSLDTDSGKGQNAGIHESVIGLGVLLFPPVGGLLAWLSGSTAVTLWMAGLALLVGVIVQWIWWRRSV